MSSPEFCHPFALRLSSSFFGRKEYYTQNPERQPQNPQTEQTAASVGQKEREKEKKGGFQLHRVSCISIYKSILKELRNEGEKEEKCQS